MTETIGFIAAVFTTFAYLPQFLKVWKSRSAKDISLKMYTMMCAGVLLWLVYGLRLRSLPIIVANSVTLALTVSILALKIKHR